MTKVRFIGIDGDDRVLEAEPGESIMQVAVRGGITQIVGECGGELSCATCHVYLDERDDLAPISDDEDDMLELVDDRTERSRLSCQIKLHPDTPDVEVWVPAS